MVFPIIIAATSNRHKLSEIRQILKVRVKGQVARVKENGRTFEANAIKKVMVIKLQPGQIAIADDSGLMVDCLGGKPGVRSARFATPPTPENLCRKLLRVMRNAKCVRRNAKFVCVIAIAYPSGKIKTVKGICCGTIIQEMRGSHGFGYDPIFVPAGYKKTFAEMKPVMKNRLSHRARALRKLSALCLFISFVFLLAAPSFSADKKYFFYNIDAGYVNNDRTQGVIAADRNIEGAIKVINKLSEDSQLEFRERFSSLQALGSQTQNHDVGVVYSTKLPTGKLNTEIGLRPFSDTTNTANTNTEGRLAVTYAQALGQNSSYTVKGNYKNQSWINKSAQDYNLAQLAVNYQDRLDGSADLSTSLGYVLQGANTAASAFSNLTAGVSYQRAAAKNRKLAVSYSFDNRNYPSNAAASAAKNELGLNLGLGAVDFGIGLTQYTVPANEDSGYQGFNLNQGLAQALSDFAKWKIKTGLLYRTSAGAANSFAKINLQAAYEQPLSVNQNLILSNLLENTSYRNTASNFLHNLLGIKYELRLADNSALSLGERFTVDDYPFAASKNATRHQIDLTYQLAIWSGLPVFLSGGYEIKSFSNPSAAQSDYRATNLAVSFDYPFSAEGKTSFSLARFSKQNVQNSSADTQDGNITLRTAYNF